jgi:hypothetical protein
MKDTIKIGDTVVRRVSDRVDWWNNSCNKHKLPVDGHYVVVGFSDSGGLRLQGFHSDYSFTETCFDVVELTPEQEYKEAKKLIGKTVVVKNEPSVKIKVTSIVYRMGDDADDLSFACQDYLKKHGYLIAVRGGLYSRPFLEIEEVTSDINVKLNDNHDAIVTKDGIKVGCQTFSHDIVEKLKNAIEEINK